MMSCDTHRPIKLGFKFTKAQAEHYSLSGQSAQNTHCGDCGRTMIVDSNGIVAWLDLSLIPTEAWA